jgi:hypothetical protein
MTATSINNSLALIGPINIRLGLEIEQGHSCADFRAQSLDGQAVQRNLADALVAAN